VAEAPGLTRLDVSALVVLGLAIAGPLAGQDPAPPDSVPLDPVQRDSARLDTARLDSLEVLPDSVREVFADTVPARAQRFPGRLAPLRGAAHEVFSCDRACVLASTSFSLLELLTEFVPGLTFVRAGFFAGPHHAYDGPLGPGFGALYIDGREIVSLERAQVDLRRLSLNYVDRVNVFRGADGFVIDVDLIRHDGTRAYSRIGGGTGDPSTQILDGIFANSIGTSFNFEGGFELLDVNAGNVENDRFGALARLSWMPRSNDFGVQLEFRREAVDRAASDTADVRRNEMVLRTRANFGERSQLEAYAMTTNYRLEVPGLPDSVAAPSREADGVGFRFTAMPGNGVLTASTRFMGGDAYPSFSADVAGWFPVGPLWLEGGAELARWTDFSTRSLRAGIAYADTLLVPITVRAFAATGDRGVGDPMLVAADSVGFEAVGASLNLELGPFDVSGRYGSQQLDRQRSLGLFSGPVIADSGAVEITSIEGRIEGPVVPLGALISGLEPIRLRAWWRQNASGGAEALFVPDNNMRFELSLHDTFFDGNLDLWVSGFMERRGQRLAPSSTSPDPVLLGADTWSGGHFMFRIGDFRFFWRFTNPTASLVSDIPGANFPRQINVFGIRWEFFN